MLWRRAAGSHSRQHVRGKSRPCLWEPLQAAIDIAAGFGGAIAA
jgi:hypothetical protein